MKITGNIKKDKQALQKRLNSDDVIFFDFPLGKRDATVIYVDSITDKEVLGLHVIRPLSQFSDDFSTEKLKSAVLLANTKEGTEMKMTTMKEIR